MGLVGKLRIVTCFLLSVSGKTSQQLTEYSPAESYILSGELYLNIKLLLTPTYSLCYFSSAARCLTESKLRLTA